MIVNGREYRFNRIVKLEFYKNVKGKRQLDYVIEFNPIKERRLCAHIDIDVLGLPQPAKQDSPDFSASATIYNPPAELLAKIAKQNSFISDMVKDTSGGDSSLILSDTESQKESDVPWYRRFLNFFINKKPVHKDTPPEKKEYIEDTLVKFYSTRYWIVARAGYRDAETQTDHYEKVFQGFLNGSAFWHKGTDNILQINCHNIDLTTVEPGTIFYSMDKETRRTLEHKVEQRFDERRKGRPTFDQTFRNYIQYFAPDEVRQDGKVYPRLLTEVKLTNFEVWYVRSRHEVIQGLKKGKGFDRSWEYPDLRTLLTSTSQQQPMSPNFSNFYTAKPSLREMLNDVCSAVFLNRKNGETMTISWDVIKQNVTKSTYIVYPIGDDPKTVPLSQVTHKIWNYQNLLEAPSLDGAGQMTIKMLLRPEIHALDSIALMLSPNLGKDEGLAPISSFESSIHYGKNLTLGTMASSANSRLTPTVQMSESAAVAALRKGTKEAQYGGYMFNRGFVISRYEHRLSTHNSDWYTVVKTVPMYGGTKVQ